MSFFNLSAAKAYVGGVVAAAGLPVATFFIGIFESLTGIDIPASMEAMIVTAFAYVLGHAAVYLVPNKAP